jgi:DNA-binding NtrC family response regulator
LEAEQIDIFVSPGTPAMQTAWYLSAMNLALPIQLLQTRAAKFTADKKPELIEINLKQSSVPVTAILSNKVLSRPKPDADHLITSSLHVVYDRASKAAKTDTVHVLIKGETGSGKEHLANFIHTESERRDKRFLAVNCASISDELLYSQLFGHKKGSFTGAEKDHQGFFQEAHQGTIFLDEIGDISARMQQALLRVLQEGEVLALGANKPTKVDVRVVVASHQDLPELCKAGKFRWDLYYRLAVVELELPPLRKRGASEIWEMVDFLNRRSKKELRRGELLSFSTAARQAVLNYPWPGNVREMENMIRRLYVFEEGEVKLEQLPARMREGGGPESLLLEDAIQRHVEMVLRHKEGNQRQTALALGIAVNTLRKRLGGV